MIYPDATPFSRALYRRGTLSWDAAYAAPSGERPGLVLDFDQQVFGIDGALVANPLTGARLGRPAWDGAATGLLIEPARNNTVTHSTATAANWAQVGAAVLTDLALAKFGTFPGMSIASGGATWHRAQVNSQSFTAGAKYFLTLLYGAGSANSLRVTFYSAATSPATNLEVGGAPGACAVTIQNGGVVSSVENKDLGNGVYRLRIGFALDTTLSSAWGVGPGSATVGSDVTAFAMQIEQGQAATGLITTTGVAATRSADVLNLAQTGWSGAAEGTVIVDAGAETALDCAFATLAMNGGQAIGLYKTAAGQAALRMDGPGGQQTLTDGSAITGTTRKRYAFSWGASGVSLCAQGGAVVSAAAPEMTTPDFLDFSVTGIGETYGPSMIGYLAVYKYRLSDATLQALTAQ